MSSCRPASLRLGVRMACRVDASCPHTPGTPPGDPLGHHGPTAALQGPAGQGHADAHQPSLGPCGSRPGPGAREEHRQRPRQGPRQGPWEGTGTERPFPKGQQKAVSRHRAVCVPCVCLCLCLYYPQSCPRWALGPLNAYAQLLSSVPESRFPFCVNWEWLVSQAGRGGAGRGGEERGGKERGGERRGRAHLPAAGLPAP